MNAATPRSVGIIRQEPFQDVLAHEPVSFPLPLPAGERVSETTPPEGRGREGATHGAPSYSVSQTVSSWLLR